MASTRRISIDGLVVVHGAHQCGRSAGNIIGLRLPGGSAYGRWVTDMPTRTRHLEHINWRVVNVCAVIGAAFVALSAIFELTWGWIGWWPEFVFSVGITILLGVVLYFLQLAFVKQVSEVAEELVESVTQQTSALGEEIDRQRVTLADVTEQLRDLTAQRHEEEDESLDRLRDDVTFESLHQILRSASRNNLISDHFRVQLFDDVSRSHLHLSSGIIMDRVDGGTPHINIAIWTLNGEDPPPVIWQAGTSFAGALDELVRRMERGNSPDTNFDSQRLVDQLVKSLRESTTSGRSSASPGPRGPLIELINDEYFLTESGLERTSGELLVPIESFEQTRGFRDREPPPPYISPQRPQTISSAEWESLLPLLEVTYRGWNNWPVRRRGFPGPVIGATL